MENYDLGLKFRAVVKGRNIITPLVCGYYQRGNHIIELSYGDKPFMKEFIWGCTVVDIDTMTQNFDLSKCFTGETQEEAKIQAMEYIKSLN